MPRKPRPPADDGGKKYPPYPPESWIPEIPFDVADWGDKPGAWPRELFRSEAEYEAAVKASEDRPQGPSHPDVEPTADKEEL